MKKAFNLLGISGASVGEALVLEINTTHRASDLQAIHQLLACGTIADIPQTYLDKALRLSARHETPAIAKILIFHGANVNAHNDSSHGHGETPLMIAAAWGVPDTVAALLEAGADISARDDYWMTARGLAETHKKHENAGILKSAEATPVTPAPPKQPKFTMSSGR